MKSDLKANLMLHLIVLIFGFTGILGKMITLDSDLLVLYRMLIAAIGIWAYAFVAKKNDPLPWKKKLYLVFIGGIIALHWITFFESIKVSNVSVALVCISSASLFSAFLEPLFFRRRINPIEIFFGLMVIGGLALIFNFEPKYQLGIVLSCISAFLASLFTVLNGKLVKTINPTQISAYEISGGALFILGYFLLGSPISMETFFVGTSDLFYLIILGLICTSFAFVASVKVMQKLSPFTVTLSINLEPVYAIIMAFLFFNEYENVGWSFFVGGSMIIGTVILNAALKNIGRLKNRRSWMARFIPNKTTRF